MDTSTIIGVGVGIGAGCVLIYLGYRFLKGRDGNNDSEDDCDYVKPDIEKVETIDYEMLYQWLKVEYSRHKPNINAGAKFGIMPNSIARNTFKEETGKDISINQGEELLCVFVIDKEEKNVITHKYYRYSHMAQSLKDLILKDKVYIQHLKE